MTDYQRDSDNDGVANWRENRDGTNPYDSADANVEIPGYVLIDLGPDYFIKKIANNGCAWFSTFSGPVVWQQGEPVDVGTAFTEYSRFEITAMNGQGDFAESYYFDGTGVPSWKARIVKHDRTSLQLSPGSASEEAHVTGMSNYFYIGRVGTGYYNWSMLDGDCRYTDQREALGDAAIWTESGIPVTLGGTGHYGLEVDDDVFECNLSYYYLYFSGTEHYPLFVNDNGDLVKMSWTGRWFKDGNMQHRNQGVRQTYFNGWPIDFEPLGLNNNNILIGRKGDWRGGWWQSGEWHDLIGGSSVPVDINNRNSILAVGRSSDSLVSLFLRNSVTSNYIKYTLEDLMTSRWRLSRTEDVRMNDDHVIGLRAKCQSVDENGVPSGSSVEKAVLLVPCALSIDANRDGSIVSSTCENISAALSVDTVSQQRPFCFWSNEDDDNGDTSGGDRAVATNPAMNNGPANWQGDGSYFGVNGVRDLVDFFPVFLDLKQLLTVLPATTPGVKYKLKQADSALNFVYTGLTRANALSYQTENNGAIYGPQFDKVVGQAETHWITAEGAELSAAFLTRIQQQDQGVILVEGRKATTQPLVLSVEKDGAVITEVKLHLSISSVEDMYRRINLRDGAEAPPGLVGDLSVRNADLGLPTSIGEPANFADSLTNGKWFVFIVGSNVGGQKMRGWQSEVFKRMYWSKSNARFVGVSWYGDPYSDGNDLVYDYHSAARNAFTTAPALTAKLNALAGMKTIAGHSAAALIISSAVADHGLSVSSACLIDAAMARECFDGGSADDITGMVPAVWRDHPSAYWASHWHEAFDAADARSRLTWRNRFSGAAGVVHNFYSSTEDVLGRYDGTVNASIIENLRAPGSFAWVIQEKAKGDKLRIGWFIHGGSDYGGWGFNRKDPLFEIDGTHWKWDPSLGRLPKTAAELGRSLRRSCGVIPSLSRVGANSASMSGCSTPRRLNTPARAGFLISTARRRATLLPPTRSSARNSSTRPSRR